MRLTLLLTVAVLTGCASVNAYPFDTPSARSRQQLTEKAARQDVVVRTDSEAGISARSLSIRADSTSWVDPTTGATRTVGTDQLRAVSIPGRQGGTLPTIAIGLGGGILGGGLLGYGAYEAGIGKNVLDSSGEAALYGAAGGAVLGLLSGAFVSSERRRMQLFRVTAPASTP